MNYICKNCGKTYEINSSLIMCNCGSPLWLNFMGKFNRNDIDYHDYSMWRYSKAYPIDKKDIKISYGEGLTPYTSINYKGYSIKVKQDHLMPTGSFKDRGSSMVINHLYSQGITSFTEDSSGNGGAAYAGYCALGGLDCRIFIPAGTSKGKVAQVNIYGAKLVEVEGTRNDVATAAMKSHDGSVYVVHNWHPYFVQGTKSIAYEIWEQNGFKSPEAVITVVGNGSLITGLYIGFKELLLSGEIKKMPKIYGVQPDNCNPIYRLFFGIHEEFSPSYTIAEGASISKPNKAKEIIEFVSETSGKFLSASEGEIKEALFYVGKKGFYIEPTSALAFAGLNKLINSKELKEDEDISIIISGNGLKATDKILNLDTL